MEGQEDDSLLKAFIDLGEQCPKFLRPQLDATIELMLKVLGHYILDLYGLEKVRLLNCIVS